MPIATTRLTVESPSEEAKTGAATATITLTTLPSGGRRENLTEK